MAVFVQILAVILLTVLANEIKAAMFCWIGQEPDPESHNTHRWVIPVPDPCLCTEVRVGSLNTRTPCRPFNVTYYDTFLISGDPVQIRQWLKCPAAVATCDLNDLPDIADTEAVGCGTLNGTTAPYGTSCTLKCTNDQVPSSDVHGVCGPGSPYISVLEPSVATIICNGAWLVIKHIGIEYEEIIPAERLGQSSGDARKGRLNLNDEWCPWWAGDRYPWIEVNFSSNTLVSGVITQGHRNNERRALEYKVAYQTPNSSDYQYALNANGGVKLFTGNIDDSTTPVIQLLAKSVNAVSVRIRPTKTFNQEGPCLRFELLGPHLN